MSENTPPGWLSRLIPARRSDSLEASPVVARVVHESRLGEDDPAELAVPLPVRAAAAWSWRVLAIAAAAALVGYLVIVFKTVVVAFVVAILLAVLLDPVSSWLRKRLRFPRTLASMVTLLGTLALVVGLLTLAGRSVLAGFSDLADQATQGFEELLSWLSDGPLGIDESQLRTWLDEGMAQLEANSSALVSGALAATTSVTQVATGGIISLFCLFFFLREGRRIWQWFVRLVPTRARNRANEAGIRGWITLGHYARTQILVALVDSIGIGLGAAILGLPLVLPLSILVFLGSFIPIVGALVTGSVAVLVALVDQGVQTAVIMLLIVLLVQQIEGNLLQPWLMGNAVSLHPVAVLLAVTAGTGVAGILGALLAVPVAAVVNTVVLYLHGHDKHPSVATDWYRPGGPPGTLFRSIADSFPDDEDDGDEDATATASVPTADPTDDDERAGGPPSP
ncbi:Predicted PurR-regulated permease PerM [Georgenia satyanarayanai]|uniref:Predicted PurR-regulated permease PerM n=1 Tax=Georgenia satyanarayanai TaxID=860221 RepID=A0A2Y9A6U3_9MICO|nr:AI-2E family transporter [Georgenia satyanarayanai]PYG00879.1 putative PurR-regulated permease PerM [Georgenia satyanarayanai]SSA39118.1 Predicted PurR-regulated permease PerM [Georgenia satyanarayanai]